MNKQEQKTLHFCGNTHLDPVWRWRWQEGFENGRSTFGTVLALMREFDKQGIPITYSASTAALYQWIEQVDGAMFDEIGDRVREGRWGLVAGWVEPDENLPNGEFHIRQIGEGQDYFAKKFGVVPKVMKSDDAFGRHSRWPSIMKGFGIDYHLWKRPEAHEYRLPNETFWWADESDAVVLSHRVEEIGSWGTSLNRHIRAAVKRITYPSRNEIALFGMSNHGGEITREDIELILEKQKEYELMNVIFTFSTPEAFFKELEKEDVNWPVVYGEHTHHAPGCYASHAGVKYWNRKAENMYLAAESMAVLGAITVETPYPADDLQQARRGILFNQFHDILPGTSVEAAYEDARNIYGEANAIDSKIIALNQQAIAREIHIPHEKGMFPVVFFNHLPYEVNDYQEIHVINPNSGPVTIINENTHRLIDEDGAEYPFQSVQADYVDGNKFGMWVSVPSYGWKTYRFMPKTESTTDQSPWVEVGTHVIDNGTMRIEIDQETGGLTAFDKKAGYQVFYEPSLIPLLYTDEDDTWKHFSSGYYTLAEGYEFKLLKTSLVETGLVQSTIEVEHQLLHRGSPTKTSVVTRYRVYPHTPIVDAEIMIDFHQQQQALRFKFSPNIRPYSHVAYETGLSVTERPMTGEEVPGLRFASIWGQPRTYLPNGDKPRRGVTLINDGKYSFSTNAYQELFITAARGTVYNHHTPSQLMPGVRYRYMDQGEHSFRLRLLMTEESWIEADAVRRAQMFNQPLEALVTSAHPGRLRQSESLLAIDSDQIVVDAIKESKDRNGYIVRLRETYKKPTKTTRITFMGRVHTSTFGNSEIKTLYFPKLSTDPVVETDLTESLT